MPSIVLAVKYLGLEMVRARVSVRVRVRVRDWVGVRVRAGVRVMLMISQPARVASAAALAASWRSDHPLSPPG